MATGRPRLLLVEDDRVVALEMAGRLKALGYQLAGTAGTGEEAVEAALAARPDLVLADISLAGDMDGIEASRRIRELMDVPVIFLTGHEDREIVERAKISAPLGYLIKPFENRDLRAAVEIALSRHAMERRLRESEEKYRELVELLSEGVLRTDDRGVITFANTAMADILGATVEEVTGTSLYDWLCADSAQVTLRQFEQRAAGLRGTYEVSLCRPDGERRQALVAASPRFKGSVFAGSVAAITDVTERRQAQAALAQAEERYRSIFENALVGIYRSTPDGRLLAVNPATASILGYDSPAELLRLVRDIAGQVYADDGRREAFLAALREDGSVDAFESAVYGRDGDLLWITESARATRGPDGEVLHIDGTLVDITARKEAEQAYSSTFELLGRTIDAIPDCIAVTDLGDSIIMANAAFARTFAPGATSLEGRSYVQLVRAGSAVIPRPAGPEGPSGPGEPGGPGDSGEPPGRGLACKALVDHKGLGRRFHEMTSGFPGLHGETIGRVRVLWPAHHQKAGSGDATPVAD